MMAPFATRRRALSSPFRDICRAHPDYGPPAAGKMSSESSPKDLGTKAESRTVIQLRTLGDIYAENEHGTIDALVTRPKLFALLTYLVLDSAPGFHQRDTLLALFWPDSDESHARNNLRQSLHVLSRTLGPGVVVRRGRTLVGVNRSMIVCDAATFKTALDERRFADALDVYRGAFLAGFYAKGASGFNDWADAESDRLRTLAARAARSCAEGADADGRWEDAIREWVRVRGFDPLDENALARLVSTLLQAGLRQEATRQYDRFLRHLDELGLPPSDEIVDLMRTQLDSGPSQ